MFRLIDPITKVVKINRALRFTKAYIFNDYVQEMFKLKAISKGAERWMAKLLLNSLYGLFGRKQEIIQTVTIDNSELETYLATRIIKTIIKIDDSKSTLLIVGNVNNQVLRELNNHYQEIGSFNTLVKANVGIASAITSYARIFMNQFKQDPNIIYTDTDSLLTTSKLDDSLIGKDLGQFKDELDGLLIKEIYVLGVKQYGYYYINKDGLRIERSVWAGVARDSLTFHEIKQLFNGEVLTKNIYNRFYKSTTNLSIAIRDVKLTIQALPHKKLEGNNYKPNYLIDNDNDPISRKLKEYINIIQRNLNGIPILLSYIV